jgi:hypothetical protein
MMPGWAVFICVLCGFGAGWCIGYMTGYFHGYNWARHFAPNSIPTYKQMVGMS